MKGVTMARTTVHSSQFIVGSVTKCGANYSISQRPEIHTEYQKALHEAQRLAQIYPEKKFIVWAAVAVAQVDSNPVLTTYSL
jgi:hypothetical protein